jgi:hypothetical protein
LRGLSCLADPHVLHLISLAEYFWEKAHALSDFKASAEKVNDVATRDLCTQLLPMTVPQTPLPQFRVMDRYLIGCGMAVVAVLMRELLDPVLGHVAFYVTVYIAVAFSAIVCLWPEAAGTFIIMGGVTRG